MPNLRQLLLGLACVSLFACAAGVPGDELDFTAEEAPQLDAGLPPLATALPPSLSGPILPAAAPQAPAQSAPTNSSSVSQSSSAASVPSPTTTPTTSTPSTSTPTTSTSSMSTPQATTPATPSTSTLDAGVSSTRDAGSSTPATPTPAPAPMCVASKCNINCALLRPCCDQQGQCMCLSPIRGCVLPPL